MTRKSELETVIREGKRLRSRHFDVRHLASPLGSPRVGVIIPRHGHTAVDRNKLKRRVREIVRLELLPHLPAVDLVIRARATAYARQFAELSAELSDVRAGL